MMNRYGASPRAIGLPEQDFVWGKRASLALLAYGNFNEVLIAHTIWQMNEEAIIKICLRNFLFQVGLPLIPILIR